MPTILRSRKTMLIVSAAVCAVLIVGLWGFGSNQETESPEHYLSLGEKYLSELNYEEAILAFTKVIEVDPNLPAAYLGRAAAYIGSGETEGNLATALSDYEAALALDETNAEAWLGLADVYIRMGDYDKALEVLQEGLQKSGDQSIADKIAEVESGNITDSSGKVRRLNGYDEIGNLLWYHIYSYGADGKQSAATSYDAFGNQTGHIDYTYDEHGNQLYGVGGYSNETGTLEPAAIFLNAEGKTAEIRWLNDDGTYSSWVYEYDSNGHQTKKQHYGEDGTLYDTTVYENGNLIKESLYDSNGDLWNWSEHEYDSEGRRTGSRFYNETGDMTGGVRYYFDDVGNYLGSEQYDSEGNLTHSTVQE